MSKFYNVKKYPDKLPVIISRGLVIFPEGETTLEIARPFTSAAVKAAKKTDNTILVLTQKDISLDNPTCDDVFKIGTVVKIKQVIKAKGELKVYVSGMSRAISENLVFNGEYFESEAAIPLSKENYMLPEYEAVTKELFELLREYTDYMPHISDDLIKRISATDDLGEICDIVADNLLTSANQRQQILEEIPAIERATKLCGIVSHEIEIIKLEIDISSKVRSNIDKSQRDYYLKEQLKVIQNELNSDEFGFSSDDEETTEYLKKIADKKLPENVREKLTKEVYKLEKFPFSSPEYSLLKSYIDTCLDIPFSDRTKDSVDLAKARKILDNDHYGLIKVKERIYEFIAAKKYNPEYKGQILCLVGPPGVGKTSVASSIAKALGRKMVRISLGGIHDEADIRGHRKTYIGAMPGRIINAINNAGVMNPLILFDEIDKMGGDGYHGDPASALLEVLDVEQNKAFRDHFVEFDIDLSDCMFICTANTSSTIPHPLLDRMEIVELNSYTMNEKVHIAKKHLIPRQMKLHKLTSKDFAICDKAIIKLIELYTKESGVRNLEREIAKICRCSIKSMLDENKSKININEKNLEKFSGKPKYIEEQTANSDEVGLVNGLAWTEVGGELLQVEAVVMPGTGKIELTGSLGDVMKESAHASISYIRTKSNSFGIDEEFYKNKDIHIHFPDGATPKDGPSAGIAITTCLISALTGKPVNHNIAMTGEVTIRGKVLPIGGLKEKTMAAASHKIKKVLIPYDNTPDLSEIDTEVKDALEFVTVSTVDDVIAEAFPISPVIHSDSKKSLKSLSKSITNYAK